MTSELRAGAALDPAAYARLTHRAVFECCKWTLAAHDTPTLARFPLLVTRAHYAGLARIAEALAAEALAAELELLRRPELAAGLGLPDALRAELVSATPSSASRYLRIDFHPTPEGYRITEANTDVCGGLIEGSGVSKIWRALGAGTEPGDPLATLAASLLTRHGSGARIGLMHLPRFVDDRQLVAFVAKGFEQAGLKPVPFDAGLPWPERLAAVYRYFPAEWLPMLDAALPWRELVRSNATTNPLTTLFTASKRFPLVWPMLETRLPTWKQLLPRTTEVTPGCDRDPNAVLKPALGNEGTHVCIEGVIEPQQRRAIAAAASRAPSQWVQQERFESTPIQTPDGPRHACVGIYVVDGKAAGAYGRLAAQPLIGADAQDAAVLLEDR